MSFFIRNWARGNPGNIMMLYLSALKAQKYFGFGEIVNVDIPLFDISIPDIRASGCGIHDYMHANRRNMGYIPLKGIKKAIQNSNCTHLRLEGFCQNIENFPPIDSIDYNAIFPPLPQENGGGDNDIVINIRGGEVLKGIHPHYCLIPPEFYEYVITKTGKNPIFCGQIERNPYMDEIFSRFPNAKYIPSSGPKSDFDFMRKSKHIIPSLSTFSWMACWLSDATTIHFPVAGIFNPFQHRSSMLLPFNDRRYSFYLFPIYFSKSIHQYREYLDPVRSGWKEISHHKLSKIIPKYEKNIDDYISALDIREYIKKNNDVKESFVRYGNTGVYNHYMSKGNLKHEYRKEIDITKYIQKYPFLSMELISGDYEDASDHYIKIGQYLGLEI